MFALLQAAGDATRDPLTTSYGASLLQTLLALGAVCLLAWVVLRWGAKKGLMLGGRGRHIQIIERVALDPRRSLSLVRVGEKLLLIGVGDGAAPTLLKELSERDLAEGEIAPSTSFRDVLKRTVREEE